MEASSEGKSLTIYSEKVREASRSEYLSETSNARNNLKIGIGRLQKNSRFRWGFPPRRINVTVQITKCSAPIIGEIIISSEERWRTTENPGPPCWKRKNDLYTPQINGASFDREASTLWSKKYLYSDHSAKIVYVGALCIERKVILLKDLIISSQCFTIWPG